MNSILNTMVNKGIHYSSRHVTRILAEKFGKKYIAKYMVSVFLKWLFSLVLNISGILILILKPWNDKINDLVGSSLFLLAFLVPFIRLIIWLIKKSKRTTNAVKTAYYGTILLKAKVKNNRFITAFREKVSLRNIFVVFLSVVWIEILVFIIICLLYFGFMWIIKPYLVKEFIGYTTRDILLFPFVFIYKCIFQK